MNFKSQICTTKEQSERLLKLGIKAETEKKANEEIVLLATLLHAVDNIEISPEEMIIFMPFIEA